MIMRGALRADHSGKIFNRSSYIKFSSNYCYTAGRDPDFHIGRSAAKSPQALVFTAFVGIMIQLFNYSLKTCFANRSIYNAAIISVGAAAAVGLILYYDQVRIGEAA